jgi:integrase
MKLARGEDVGAAVKTNKTFEEFTKQWFELFVVTNNKASEQRAKRYILSRHLVPAFGKSLIDEIDVLSIERYKAGLLRSRLSPKTINNHLTVLRRCLQSAFDWGQIGSVPRIQWLKRPPGRIDYLSDKECLQLISDEQEPQWNLMVRMALLTGMRVSELLALDWSDVNINQSTIIIRRSASRGVMTSPKSNRTRSIPITNDLMQAFWLVKKKQGLLFGHDGERMRSYDAADRALTRICQRTGVREVGWHTLRHTFATQLVDRGAAMREIQELLGHTTITMTEKYAHVASTSLRRAVDLLGGQMANRGQQVVNTWAQEANTRPLQLIETWL